MTIVNDYDRFAAQRQVNLKKGLTLPHRFVEKPAMKALLPNLTSKRVLMLGCGTGEESLILEEAGAKNLVGIDLSAQSIELANGTYPDHVFKVGDMHSLDFENNSFDFVYSSLTVHYSERPLDVYKEIHRVLKPGGVLLFSVGHPVRWASERKTIDGKVTKLLGYTEGDEEVILHGDYSGFNKYDETFPSGEILSFWVGPPSMHFGLLKEAGFTVSDFIETKAVEETKAVNEYYYKRFSHFPQFSVFAATKL